jgi:hypothetical protein
MTVNENKLIRIRLKQFDNAQQISEALVKDGFGVSMTLWKNGKGTDLTARRIKGQEPIRDYPEER